MGKKVEPLTESYFYILLCLAKKPGHGYGIMQMTEQLSQGEVKIGSGTMYGATGNMMKKGWIEETISEEEGAERKRMYRLTESGRNVLQEEIARLNRLFDGIREVFPESGNR